MSTDYLMELLAGYLEAIEKDQLKAEDKYKLSSEALQTASVLYSEVYRVFSKCNSEVRLEGSM